MPQIIDNSPGIGNGHSGVEMENGHSNGAARTEEGESTMTDAMDYAQGAVFKPLWEGSQVDRREFVRLAMQTFKDLGYTFVYRTVSTKRFANESC